ncbi:hypothetical protein D322_4229 [Yersinia enterocolitica IP 10393]|nr:hypothetical protein D322_4229 [Yersinia enterocolitica IP 10393]
MKSCGCWQGFLWAKKWCLYEKVLSHYQSDTYHHDKFSI